MITMALIGIIFFLLVVIIGLIFVLLVTKKPIEITNATGVAVKPEVKKEGGFEIIKRPTVEELERKALPKSQRDEEDAWDELNI